MSKFPRLLPLAALATLALAAGCAPKSSNVFTMITEATFPPYEFRRGTEIVGIDIAISQAIANELGKTLRVDDAKFDAVIPSLIAGKADLAAAGITITEDRKQAVDFSIPYVTSGIVVISLVHQKYETADSLIGKTVGVQSGTTSDTFLVDTLKQEPDRYDSPAAAVAALKAGKIDAVIADIDPAKNLVMGDPEILISSDFLTKEEFAVAIRKGQPELLALINRVITRLRNSGELDTIIARYTAEADALKTVD